MLKDLEHVVGQAFELARTGVIVDIQHLAFIDAAGFRSLERLQHAAEAQGFSFVVLLDPWKMRIAKVTQVDLNVRLAPHPGDARAQAALVAA